jgi:single-strand DNA-binding protein
MYIDCEAYARPDAKRNLVDVIHRYVKQGDQIFIEGRLQLDEWQDKTSGQQRSKHKVVIDSIELLGGKSDGSGGGGDSGGGGYGGGGYGGGESRAPQQAPRGGGNQGNSNYSAPDDDMGNDSGNGDIPF